VELTEALRRRRMVRRYDPGRPVSVDLVDAVIDAALRAPSAGFTQGVQYQVLRDDQVAAYWTVTARPGPVDRWSAGMRTAPVLVLVWTQRSAYLQRYAEPDKGWDAADQSRWSAPYWWVDAGMGVMAALLQAVDCGLGACFFGVPPDRVLAVRERFAVPADRESVGVLSLGHPARSAPRRPRRSRRARDELVRYGQWEPATD
jgi:nitroreductase